MLCRMQKPWLICIRIELWLLALISIVGHIERVLISSFRFWGSIRRTFGKIWTLMRWNGMLEMEFHLVIDFEDNFFFSSFSPNWLIASVIKLTDNQRTELLDVASKSDQSILILDKCPASVMKRSTSSVDMRCSHGTTTTYDYKTAFSQSVFCLVAKTERFFQINFIEALAANCIPVIYADNVVLPFIEVMHVASNVYIEFIWRYSTFFSR